MFSTVPFLGFIDRIGGGEMIFIFFVILLLFGGQRLPELARGLGRSIREFKKATSGVENEIKRALEEPAPSRPKTSPTLAASPAATPPVAAPMADDDLPPSAKPTE